MSIHEPLPSFLRFGRRLVQLHHQGQVPTCRKCSQPGHEAKSCVNKFCFNCEKIGHEAPDCVHDIRCSICKAAGHLAFHCKYTWCREDSHRDAPVDDRPGTSLTNEVQDSQPLFPASEDALVPSSSPQSVSGSSSSSSTTSGSPSSSSITQSPSQSIDIDNDKDDEKDDDDDVDDDAMNTTLPDMDKMDVSILLTDQLTLKNR